MSDSEKQQAPSENAMTVDSNKKEEKQNPQETGDDKTSTNGNGEKDEMKDETSSSKVDEAKEEKDDDQSPKKKKKKKSSRRSRDRSRDRDRDRRSSRDRSRRDRSRRDRSRERSRRDRDRRRRGSKRSRSRERRRRRRSISSSRSRSRSPKRSRKSKKFDADAIANTLAVLDGKNVALPQTNPEEKRNMIVQLQAQNPQITRQARRLYVGNLPVAMGLTEQMLSEYFSTLSAHLQVKTPNPVMSVWLSTEGTFCFVEYRSVQDCSAMLALLQGLSLGGRVLRIGRPADYKPPPPALANFIVGYANGEFEPPPSNPTQISATPSIGSTSLMASGVAPTGTGAPLVGIGGVAPVPSVTSTAGGLSMAMNPAVAQMGLAVNPAAVGAVNTRVLVLLNMVTEEDLKDYDEFHDTVLDVREECEKFGKVNQVVIPRPAGIEEKHIDNDKGPCVGGVGVGRIFVEFESINACLSAKTALHGRKFNQNTVIGQCYDEQLFAAGDYTK